MWGIFKTLTNALSNTSFGLLYIVSITHLYSYISSWKYIYVCMHVLECVQGGYWVCFFFFGFGVLGVGPAFCRSNFFSFLYVLMFNHLYNAGNFFRDVQITIGSSIFERLLMLRCIRLKFCWDFIFCFYLVQVKPTCICALLKSRLWCYRGLL